MPKFICHYEIELRGKRTVEAEDDIEAELITLEEVFDITNADYKDVWCEEVED